MRGREGRDRNRAVRRWAREPHGRAAGGGTRRDTAQEAHGCPGRRAPRPALGTGLGEWTGRMGTKTTVDAEWVNVAVLGEHVDGHNERA